MQLDHKIYLALFISLLLHIGIVTGISFHPPQPTTRISKSIDVVLVNSKSHTKPADAKIYAQANLEGGGNVMEERQAKTPLLALPGVKPMQDLATATKKTEQLEQQVKEFMAAANSKTHIAQPLPKTKPTPSTPTPSQSTNINLNEIIANLSAEIAKDHEAYQKRPKRKFIGARTKEYRFARYLEDWRLKVERIGNLNYPEEARRKKLYGSLQLTVGIRADGSLESIGIDRSSGTQTLDNAAIQIVRLAARNGFAPFPPDISRDTDILHITRTWVFSRSDKLLSQ